MSSELIEVGGCERLVSIRNITVKGQPDGNAQGKKPTEIKVSLLGFRQPMTIRQIVTIIEAFGYQLGESIIMKLLLAAKGDLPYGIVTIEKIAGTETHFMITEQRTKNCEPCRAPAGLRISSADWVVVKLKSE